MRITTLVALAIGYLCVASVSAHPGGRDSNGGHVNRSTGEYHCHTADCVLPTVVPAAPTEDEEPDVDEPPGTTEAAPLTIASSWSQTKKLARDTVYAGQTNEFYCGCPYAESGSSGGGTVSHQGCGYDGSDEANAQRATVMEWEHIVPASLMPARQFTCWTEGLPECSAKGRSCCEQHDLNARAQIFDLHNLAPSLGQVNALRGNRRYAEIAGEERKLGMCDFEWTTNQAEPPQARRGDVARVWLYFNSTHGLVLQPGELEMYLQWSNSDPPDQFEITRNQRIKTQQGNGNPFVEQFAPP